MTVIALACASKPDAPVDSVSITTSYPSLNTVPSESAAVRATSPPPTAGTPTKSSPSPAVAVPRPATPQPSAASDVHTEDQSVVVAPKLSQVDTTIILRANGPELIFDPATITLKQGTRVRLRFTNMGSFAHNFILARDERDIDELAVRARDAAENVPLSLKSKMIVYTNIAQPTQTVETAFVVPPPGEYTYVCLVEGHANTMLGKLRSIP
jgi:plastocyanin